MRDLDWSFPQRLLLTTAVVLVLLLLWQLSDVVVLSFGGVVLATMLRGIATRLERWVGVPSHAAAALSALLVVFVLGLTVWLVGDALAEQIARLQERLPQAWAALRAWLGDHALGRQLLRALHRAWNSAFFDGQLASLATMTVSALGSTLLIIIVGVYMAVDPRTYRIGLVSLIPPPYRTRVREALEASSEALSRWLLGQGISMLFLGTSTAIGLALLGLPLAPALGLITGLLAFVPFLGAITAGVLSVLLSFVEGPDKALYVALLFLALQQVEEYVLLPFVQRWAVELPPVLTLFSTLIFGILFGPIGVVFATPMMVIAMVLTRKLYIEETLQAEEAPGGRLVLPGKND